MVRASFSSMNHASPRALTGKWPFQATNAYLTGQAGTLQYIRCDAHDLEHLSTKARPVPAVQHFAQCLVWLKRIGLPVP